MANSSNSNTGGHSGNDNTAQSQQEKSFLETARETVAGAVDATVQAVKDRPVAAAAVAAGAAAAVGGAVYAATQLGGEKEAGAKKDSGAKK